MQKWILFIGLLIGFGGLSYAQEREDKPFKLVYLSKPLAGAIVLNKADREFKITNEMGMADLALQIGDSIEFSHSATQTFVMYIDEFFMSQDTIDIQMRNRVVELDAVELRDIDQANILNGVDNAGKTPLTEAERELNAKTNVNPVGRTDGLVGGYVTVDFVYNWVSGKTKEAKKRRSVELRQESLDYLLFNFEDYFINTLNFESGRMNRLFEASLDDKEVHDMIADKNNQGLKIYLINLSEEIK